MSETLPTAPALGSSRLAWKLRRSAISVALAGRDIDYSNFYQNDNVAVFPALGIILNRVKKSGNSSVVAFLDNLERARSVGGVGAAPASVQEVKSLRRLHVLPLSAILRLRGFATLATVRNPYHRTISGFLDKIAGGTNPRYADYPCFGESSVAAFETFLTACRKGDFFGNRHFQPQVRLLFQPASHFTAIARLERLVADMDALLVTRGYPVGTAASLAEPHPLERRDATKIQNSTEKEHYLSESAMRLIEDLYSEDFETFGYDRLRRG